MSRRCRSIAAVIAAVSASVLAMTGGVDAPATALPGASPVRDSSTTTWRVAWGTALHATVASSTWDAHPTPPGATSKNATYRFVATPTVRGKAIRLRLSNWFDYGLGITGLQPITFDSVTVALRDGRTGAAAKPGTMRAVTFDGGRKLTLLANQSRLSDPVRLRVSGTAALVVSVHTAASDLTPPVHAQTFVTQYATPPGAGDRTADISGEAFTRQQESIFWLDAIDVRTRARNSVVAIGDSITDGDHCGNRKANGACAYNDDAYIDRLSTYPGYLARRIRADHRLPATAVVNKGVNGAISLQTRLVLNDDVLGQSNVTAAIVEIGTNDLTIGIPLAVVKANLTAMARALRTRGILSIGATLVPRADMTGATALADSARARLNEWIRKSGTFDRVLDIAAVVGTGPDDNTYRPLYDSGDHLHPNAAGQRAIANSLSLSFLQR